MDYIRQIYDEGLGYLFCVKPINYLSKVIKNKGIVKVIGLLIKIIYTILLIGFIAIYVYKKIK